MTATAIGSLNTKPSDPECRTHDMKTQAVTVACKKEAVIEPNGRDRQTGTRAADTVSSPMAEPLVEWRQLQEDILRISSFERQRIGHELHDDLCQKLAGIACLSKQLQRRLAKYDLKLSACAEEITNELSEALDRIRSVSHEFAPLHLEESDLAPSLRTLVEQTRDRTGIAIESVIDDSIRIEPVSIRLHLYRLSQEAMRNAIQHGQATEIRVELQRQAPGKIRLAIIDNGLGFQPEKSFSEGLGIRLMRYRCSEIGAALSLRSQQDGGTVVECVLPDPANKIQDVVNTEEIQ